MNADDRFQDFLDDRLGEDERRAFEARVAREPELARRLAEHRALRAALREAEPLPPGFHARARAAFERSHRRSRRGGRFGLLPWEAVGLAAAAGLALFLFAPGLLRDDLPSRPAQGPADLRQAPITEGGSREPRDEDRTAAAGDAGKAKDDSASFDALGRLEKQQAASPPAADRPAAPGAEAKKAAERAKANVAAPGRESGEARESGADAAPPRRDRAVAQGYAPAPSPPPASAPASTMPQVSASEAREESSRLQPAEADRGEAREPAGEAEILAGFAGPAPVRAIPIPAGAVEARSIASIVDPAALARLIGSADKNEVGELRDEKEGVAEESAPLLRPGERAVVIGPRDRPFACDGLRVVTSPTAHTLYLAAPAPGRPSGPTACVVFLPDDGLRIAVMDPP